MKKFFVLFLSIVVSGLFLSACGGGDDDVASSPPTTQQDILEGDFRAVHFIPSGDAPTVADVTFNGDGTGSGAPVTARLAGALNPTPAAAAESFTYAVTEDGSITSFDTARFGSDLVGQTNADGTLITLYDNVPGIDGLTQIAAVVKKGSGMDNSALNGDYRFVQMAYDGANVTSAVIDVTFDGSATLTVTSGQSSEGPIIGGDTMPYNVDASGGLTVGTDIGQVSPDGSVLLLADTTFLDDDFSMVMLGIRQGDGLPDATFSGDYVASQLMIDLTGVPDPLPATSGIEGTAGGGTLAGSYADSDGTAGSYSLDYSVSGSGALNFPDTGESGQISADGEAFVLADVDPADESLMFMFGIRKIAQQQ